ncbi:glutamyl-tRNA reductase [Halobacteriales archaeon QS_1_68_17]|nr:MAG: glutamyl-tRNA reductase [Halobacteriales archaeon QS_1_68_17]
MTAGTGVIAGASVAHDRATIDQIEASRAESQRAAVERLVDRPAVAEAVVLQTCNRTEAYVVTDDPDTGRAVLGSFFADVPEEVLVEMGHEASLRHLLRVAAGLESLVLGEDQILGQVRTAYEDARSVGGVGPVLEEGLTKALHVGERARTETAINEGIVSLGSAAVELADREGDIAGATALVVGAGEMGSLAAGALADAVDRLLVANRTVPHAEHVVETTAVEGSAVALDALPAAVERADVVISATGSPDPVLGTEALAGAGETLIVDIAHPRDVSPAAEELPNVTVYDLDALESITDESRHQRAAAAERVEAMIDREFERLLTQYKRRRADDAIATMYESAERVKAAELDTAFAKLDDLSAEQRAVVESMADSLVNKLLAPPTRSLRKAAEDDDWTTINTALQLFDPDFDGDPDADGPPASVADMDPSDIPEGMKSEIPTAVLEEITDD